MKKMNPAHTPDPRDTSGAIDNPRSNRGSSRSRSRRKFLGDVGGITAATLVAGVAGTPVLESVAVADQLDAGSLTGPARAEKAFNTRIQAALFQKILPLPEQPNNGDEDLFGNRIGNFSKGSPHNQLGEVDRDAYGSLLKAVTTGDPVVGSGECGMGRRPYDPIPHSPLPTPQFFRFSFPPTLCKTLVLTLNSRRLLRPTKHVCQEDPQSQAPTPFSF